jgi:hypothetical protein
MTFPAVAAFGPFSDLPRFLLCARLRQCPLALDRPSLSGPVLVRRARRSAPDGGGALRRAQSGRARLVAQAQDWAWSSTRAHLAGQDHGLVRVSPLLDRVARFADLIDGEPDYSLFTALRDAEGTGR